MPDQAQAQKEKTVTLNVQNETVENVFVQLGKQTGLKFFYDQNVVNPTDCSRQDYGANQFVFQ